MTESISQKFILELVPIRHRLFAEAQQVIKSTGGAGADIGVRAEGVLVQAVRPVFQKYVSGQGSVGNLEEAIRKELHARVSGGGVATLVEGEPDIVIPAASWARLTAAVQWEAAQLPGAKALNPDSVLLSPDPLLAPKKPKPVDDLMDGLGFSPTTRFATAALVAIVLGISLTIYLTTRKNSRLHPIAPAVTMPATTEAATQAVTTNPAGEKH